MYDQPLYAKIKAACGTFSDLEVLEKPCSSLLAEMNEKIGEFDVYNIYVRANLPRLNATTSFTLLSLSLSLLARTRALPTTTCLCTD